MNIEVFVQNVYEICKKNNTTPTAAARDCGIGSSFLSDIKRGRVPSVDKFEKLATYLGVTVSELLGETEPVPYLDTKEKTAAPSGSGQQAEFTRLFESLSPQQQKTALAMLRALKDTE